MPFHGSCAAADDRHKKLGLWAIESHNGGAWSATTRHLLATAADVVLGQETKVPQGERREQSEQTARNSGWSTAIAACTITEGGGHSAGVAVATRTHIGLGSEDGGGPELDEPRFMLRKVGGIVKGGAPCWNPLLE